LPPAEPAEPAEPAAADAGLEAARARVLRLHQAVVRLSIDPALAAAVAAGEATLELPPEDLALLRAVDPRAWGVDHYRRARLVTTTLEELPVTGALLGVAAVDSFLSSPAFTAMLSGRGSLALAAAAALAPAAGPLGLIELALARARRASPTGGSGVALVDGAQLLRLPAGAVTAYGQALTTIGDSPVQAIVDEGRRLSPPRLGPGDEHALARPTAGGGLDLQVLDPALARLLEGLRAPKAWPQAVAWARKNGAGARAERLLRELCAEGLLRKR
jgi:hypothetical protein